MEIFIIYSDAYDCFITFLADTMQSCGSIAINPATGAWQKLFGKVQFDERRLWLTRDAAIVELVGKQTGREYVGIVHLDRTRHRCCVKGDPLLTQSATLSEAPFLREPEPLLKVLRLRPDAVPSSPVAERTGPPIKMLLKRRSA